MVVERIAQLPANDRMRVSQDLGETMVIAHAVVAAESGVDVVVVIDEGVGIRKATLEARRLDRLRDQGRSFGRISLVGTLTILERAAGGAYLPDRDAMRATYGRLRGHDDGLMPIDRTNLLSAELWRRVDARSNRSC